MPSRTVRFLRLPVSLLATAAAAITLILPFPVLYEIIAEALHAPPVWVFEVTGYAMIMLALASCGYGLHSGHHFRINILSERVPKVARGLHYLTAAAEIIFGLILLAAGSLQAYASYIEGVRSNTLLQVPLVWPELALPIGGVTIFLQGLIGALDAKNSVEVRKPW